MSNQSRKITERLKQMRKVVAPEVRDPRQHWIIVRRPPEDVKPGCFFVSHANNAGKFRAMGYEILFQGFDLPLLRQYCHKLTMENPNHQPTNSAHNGPLWTAPERPDAVTLFGDQAAASGNTDIASPEGPATTGPSDTST